MKKFNWEYVLPKLRGILTAVIVVMAILMIAFHWTLAHFVFVILCGLRFLLDAILEKMNHRRDNAIIFVCGVVFVFILAVYSYFRFNILK